MKRAIAVVLGIALVYFVCQAAMENARRGPKAPGSAAAPAATEASAATTMSFDGDDYVMVGWNSLGMHCISPHFKYMCILPPYNTLMVQVVRRGNPPTIVTQGLRIDYSVDGNTTVVGKTDFWQYAPDLFGVNLKEGVGLDGFGLSGTMEAVGNHFEAPGIPLLPLSDKKVWNPYQVATVSLKTPRGATIKTTKVVLPVSDELHCDMCHAQYGDAGGFDSPIVEINILRAHDAMSGTELESQVVDDGKPVMCGECHADNALNMPGKNGVSSLSLAMHGWHSKLGDDTPGCFDCHPGPKTRCNRSAIVGMGRDSATDPGCEKCHGTIAEVAQSVADGRQPWIDEPTCEQCHGPNYTTGTDLYRNASGPCGVNCTMCHNSPHAWWPSRNPVDNTQPIQHQGTPYPLGSRCGNCHTKAQVSASPHTSFNFQWP